MHKTVFIVGLIILVVGIALTVYGFYYASSLDALIEADEWDVTWYRYNRLLRHVWRCDRFF